MLAKLPTVAKAIAAALTAGAGALATALPDGVTATEWTTVAVATVLARGHRVEGAQPAARGRPGRVTCAASR